MKLRKLLRLNQLGFGHFEAVVAIAVVAMVGVVGVYISKHNNSHAEPLSSSTLTKYTNGKIWSGYFTINSDGTGFTSVPLPAGVDAQYSNMSFDGTQVAYMNIPNLSSLGTESISGANSKTIVSLPPSQASSPPEWSPNSKWIAMTFYNSSGGIWLVRPDGTNFHALKGIPAKDKSIYLNAVSWLPNSLGLLYDPFQSANAPADSQLCTIQIDGTNNRCVAIQIGTVHVESELGSGVMSPNGNKVLLLAYNFPSGKQNAPALDIYSVNSDGTGLKRLTQFTSGQQAQVVAWSPDRTKIAYALNANGTSADGLYVMNNDGSGQIQISNQLYPDSLSWAHL